jgi:N-carbamoyl-L-amino-acid hydrolase
MLKGQANHAGTTPMHMRKDAFGGVAEIRLSIPALLEQYGAEHSVATMGVVKMEIAAPNKVPGICKFTVDIRDQNPKVLKRLSEAFKALVDDVSHRYDLEYSLVNPPSHTEPALCDEGIMKCILESCHSMDITKVRRMPSGALHDAQVISTVAPIGMIFVPSVGGVSHSNQEFTKMSDIEIGANVFVNTIYRMAQDINSPSHTTSAHHLEKEDDRLLTLMTGIPI